MTTPELLDAGDVLQQMFSTEAGLNGHLAKMDAKGQRDWLHSLLSFARQLTQEKIENNFTVLLLLTNLGYFTSKVANEAAVSALGSDYKFLFRKSSNPLINWCSARMFKNVDGAVSEFLEASAAGDKTVTREKLTGLMQAFGLQHTDLHLSGDSTKDLHALVEQYASQHGQEGALSSITGNILKEVKKNQLRLFKNAVNASKWTSWLALLQMAAMAIMTITACEGAKNKIHRGIDDIAKKRDFIKPYLKFICAALREYDDQKLLTSIPDSLRLWFNLYGDSFKQEEDLDHNDYDIRIPRHVDRVVAITKAHVQEITFLITQLISTEAHEAEKVIIRRNSHLIQTGITLVTWGMMASTLAIPAGLVVAANTYRSLTSTVTGVHWAMGATSAGHAGAALYAHCTLETLTQLKEQLEELQRQYKSLYAALESLEDVLFRLDR